MIDTHKNSILAKQCIIYPRQAEILNCSKAKLYKYQIKTRRFQSPWFLTIKAGISTHQLAIKIV